jgi:hypothetical protein
MAFGKDTKVLGDVGTFRQGVKALQANRPKFGTSSTAGPKPYFINRFQPATDEPDQIRIIKGNHEVHVGQADGSLVKQTLYYYPFVEHYHAGIKKGFICSGGPFYPFKDKREPCLGCDLYWADRTAGKKNGPMGKREMYSFTVLHYAQYAKVEQLDRATGAVRTNSEGQPYYEWHRVFQHERSKYAGREMRDAQILHWDLGFGHWNTLTEYDKEIGKSCKSCGGRDTIKMVAWTCRACGEALIDSETTTLSPKEIDDLTGQEVVCASCGHQGYMTEFVACSNCQNGQRAEIFDVDLYVKRIMDPKGGNQTSLAITSWSNPRAIDPRYAEIAKPLDLPKLFTPTPFEKQQEMLGGTRTPVAAPGPHTRPFTPIGGKPGPQY